MNAILRKTGLVLFLFCGLMSFGANQLAAEDVSVTAEVDSKTVELGSAVQYVITVKGAKDASPVTLPQIDGLELQSSGSSTSISVINGQFSTAKIFQYTLYPLRTGAFEIPAVRVMIGGKEYTTEPITVEVTAAPPPPAVPPTAASSSATGQPPGQATTEKTTSLNEKIFAVLAVPKSEYYYQEKIPVAIRMYVNDLAFRSNPNLDFAPAGFSVDDHKETNSGEQVVGGVRYQVLEHKTFVYPTRTGDLALGPAKINCELVFRRPAQRSAFGNMDDIFDNDFLQSFFGSAEVKAVTVQSPTVQIKVLPLPEEGKPQDFTGAVGQFDFKASVTPTAVKVGDPLTVKLALSGEGNFSEATVPAYSENKDFKFYEPTRNQAADKKSAEQVAIPLNADVKNLPAISFSYFDPTAKTYKTITQGPFPITVLAPAPGEELKVVGLNSPASSNSVVTAEPLGQDLVFIKPQSGKFTARGMTLSHQVFFWMLFLLVFMVWATLYAMYRRRERLATDVRFARRVKAPRAARQGLAAAEQCLQKGDQTGFYNALFKTLQDYFANRFHVSAGQVSLEFVVDRLATKKTDAAIIESIKQVFKDCEGVRYAASSVKSEEMVESLNAVRKMIDRLERL